MITDYHAKYFAHELTKAGGAGFERLQQSLFNASVDLNPHQVEAALFALRSPLSKGVLLADEVGLGKTIEAGLALCQFWAERKRKLIVICPATLRKQWQLELEEKFNLPSVILDAKSYSKKLKEGLPNPFESNEIIISSYHFISSMSQEVRKVAWNLVVIDEAHKLRNAHQSSNRMGQNIRWAMENRRKLLLTATPLQNSLTELYGLSTLIDDQMFGDLPTFRSLYANVDGDLNDLRERLSGFCRRTLRKDVTEFVRYTARHLKTIRFNPTDDEHALYEAVSRFLQREDTYAFPKRQRHLMILIVRKLMASSQVALQGTLHAILGRLIKMRDEKAEIVELPADELLDEELFEEYLEEIQMVAEERAEYSAFSDVEEPPAKEEPQKIDRRKLQVEIDEVERFLNWSFRIGTDTKTKHLLAALKTGWKKMKELGAEEKAVIFTESRRSMEYLRSFLEQNGYDGEVICYSGGGKNDPAAEQIYVEYMAKNKYDSKVNTAGSKAVMLRHALIDRFKNQGKILIATEAGAEGINLQFCSLVINYDLPWNPQRIEQRIGRCHRYGQKHDVVVINFLNERNAADKRVYDLLVHKFQLFDGIFGASDDVLGKLDSSTGLEIKILQLYQKCRTEAEIKASFDQLQLELDEVISEKLRKVKDQILENFDEEVHKLLKIDYENALRTLDEVGLKFWRLTKLALKNRAEFDDENLSFHLKQSPFPDAETGEYYLKPKTDVRQKNIGGERTAEGRIIYRMNTELGEWCLEWAEKLDVPCHEVEFNLSAYPAKISVLESLKGKSGYLLLNKVAIDSLDKEEHLLFTGFTDNLNFIPHDVLCLLFKLNAEVGEFHYIAKDMDHRLQTNMEMLANSTVQLSMENNNKLFKERQDQLTRWVDDQIAVAERALKLIKQEQRAAQRELELANNQDELREKMEKVDAIERRKRKARQRIDEVEEDYEAKRKVILTELKRKLVQKISNTPLFTIRWKVV